MPTHKNVVPLSALCVQEIAQLFIDITKYMSQCTATKKKESLPSQITEERDREQKYEENLNEKILGKNEIQEGEVSNSLTCELLEHNGCTHTAAENQAEKSPASIHEKEDKEKKRKKQEGQWTYLGVFLSNICYRS